MPILSVKPACECAGGAHLMSDRPMHRPFPAGWSRRTSRLCPWVWRVRFGPDGRRLIQVHDRAQPRPPAIRLTLVSKTLVSGDLPPRPGLAMQDDPLLDGIGQRWLAQGLGT